MDDVELQTPEDEEFIITDADGNVVDENYRIPDLTAIPQNELSVSGVIQVPDELREQPTTDAHEALQRQFNALKAESVKKDAQLQQLQNQTLTSQQEKHEADGVLLHQAVEQTKARLEGAKAAFAEALRAGPDGADRAAQAQVIIAEATAELREFSGALEQWSATPKPTRQPVQEQAPQEHTALVDRFIGTLSPKMAEFAKKHRGAIFPEGDGRPFQQALALDALARARGIELESPEYFTFIEREMKLSDPKTTGPITPPVQQQPKTNVQKKPPARAIPAAPANPGVVQNKTAGRVSLSESEMSMARRWGWSLEKYAKHKMTVQKNQDKEDYRGPRYSDRDPAIVGNR